MQERSAPCSSHGPTLRLPCALRIWPRSPNRIRRWRKIAFPLTDGRSAIPMEPIELCGFPRLRVLKLRPIANRLHRLADRIYDDVGSIDDDEVPAVLRNNLLAVPRKGQEPSLQRGVLGIYGSHLAGSHICADIDKGFVPEGVRLFFCDCIGLRNTLRHHVQVCMQSHLISGLRHSPKVKLAIAGG